MNAQPAIDVSELHKTFRGTDRADIRAVDGIDLTIAPGEIVAVLGPNGAGKSTLIDMVLGLTAPTSGTVRVFGLPPREAVAAGRVSAVLQSGGLLRDLTVSETVEVVASMFSRHSAVDDVLERAGLTDKAARRVGKCSGGEQQRLRFALALVPDPDLLILDEPTAGMDVSARRDFWAAMHAEARAGRTVVFATHYLAEADEFAERIVVVSAGRVIADGPTDEIRALATGRTVTATVTSPDAAALLRQMPGVTDVQTDGTLVTISTTDSDAVARVLLNELDARDVLISNASLEAAFVALTQEGATA